MTATKQKITQEVELIADNCARCGILFALPVFLEQQLRKNGQTFYCPNGHSLWYGKSEAERLKEQLAEQTAIAARMIDKARTAQSETDQIRAQFEHLKKRAKNGVCPCCNRSFVKLAAHMKTKHPEYV